MPRIRTRTIILTLVGLLIGGSMLAAALEPDPPDQTISSIPVDTAPAVPDATTTSTTLQVVTTPTTLDAVTDDTLELDTIRAGGRTAGAWVMASYVDTADKAPICNAVDQFTARAWLDLMIAEQPPDVNVLFAGDPNNPAHVEEFWLGARDATIDTCRDEGFIS